MGRDAVHVKKLEGSQTESEGYRLGESLLRGGRGASRCGRRVRFASEGTPMTKAVVRLRSSGESASVAGGMEQLVAVTLICPDASEKLERDGAGWGNLGGGFGDGGGGACGGWARAGRLVLVPGEAIGDFKVPASRRCGPGSREETRRRSCGVCLPFGLLRREHCVLAAADDNLATVNVEGFQAQWR